MRLRKRAGGEEKGVEEKRKGKGKGETGDGR